MNEKEPEENPDDIIIIKCGDGEIHLGPPCPPIPKEFIFKKEQQDDIATT